LSRKKERQYHRTKKKKQQRGGEGKGKGADKDKDAVSQRTLSRAGVSCIHRKREMFPEVGRASRGGKARERWAHKEGKRKNKGGFPEVGSNANHATKQKRVYQAIKEHF